MKSPKYQQHPIDRYLRILSSKGYTNEIYRDYIRYQFDFVFEPAYFGTICWHPFVFTFEEAVKETNHFKNKLFTGIHDCKPYQVPKLPGRQRIVFFQEVKYILVNPYSPNPRYRLAYHTHFHLEGSNLVGSIAELDAIVQGKVRQRFNRLQRRDSPDNKAVVIKKWDREFHMSYNVKDYYSNQHFQDGDLVTDYENSDLG